MQRDMHPKTRVKNFLFHRVNPVRDELWDPVDVQKFEQCVRYLSRNYSVLSLEEACTSRSEASDKPVATISFDDGYHDNLEYAAPILQKYKCPASFYIVTDCIDSGRMVWTQEVKHYLQTTRLLKFNSDLSYLPAPLQVKCWKNRRQRLAYAHSVRDYLLVAPQDIRYTFLDDIREAFPDVRPLSPMMTWDDVQQLHAAGFVIGSHTKTHPVLPTLHEPAAIYAELRLSGNRIEEKLGAYPVSLAYPFGAYDKRVSEAAFEAGYKYGITSNQQWYYSDRDNSFAIPRTLLSNEPWLKMLSRMNGSFERVKELIKGKQHQPWKSLILAGKGLSSAAACLATEALNTISY